jgi:hypothetical protein
VLIENNEIMPLRLSISTITMQNVVISIKQSNGDISVLEIMLVKMGCYRYVRSDEVRYAFPRLRVVTRKK